MLETWNGMSTCISSSLRSQKLSFIVLVLFTLLAFTEALPIVHTVRERSATLPKDAYSYNSSSSINNPCLTNKTALEYGWEVYCPSHPQVCVSKTWRCNGIVDCEELEDELNCSSSDERSFECMFGNVTIYLANDRMCNGQKDCPDGSDEDDGCECQDGFEFCNSFRICLPESWSCDGEVDCPDGSDERNCTSSGNGGENNQGSNAYALGSEGKGNKKAEEEEASESNKEEGMEEMRTKRLQEARRKRVEGRKVNPRSVLPDNNKC